jgi:hypothetical protein
MPSTGRNGNARNGQPTDGVHPLTRLYGPQMAPLYRPPYAVPPATPYLTTPVFQRFATGSCLAVVPHALGNCYCGAHYHVLLLETSSALALQQQCFALLAAVGGSGRLCLCALKL